MPNVTTHDDYTTTTRRLLIPAEELPAFRASLEKLRATLLRGTRSDQLLDELVRRLGVEGLRQQLETLSDPQEIVGS